MERKTYALYLLSYWNRLARRAFVRLGPYEKAAQSLRASFGERLNIDGWLTQSRRDAERTEFQTIHDPA